MEAAAADPVRPSEEAPAEAAELPAAEPKRTLAEPAAENPIPTMARTAGTASSDRQKRFADRLREGKHDMEEKNAEPDDEALSDDELMQVSGLPRKTSIFRKSKTLENTSCSTLWSRKTPILQAI